MKIDFKDLLDEYYYLKKDNEELIDENIKLLRKVLELDDVDIEEVDND